MTRANEQTAVHDSKITRPSFAASVRGYDKRQVDQHLSEVESEVSVLVAERKRALTQLQEQGTQLARLHSELTELRKRPAQIDRASFRHLGPMVDQILALAEKQAEAIVATAIEHREKAEQEIDARKAEDEALLEAARQQAEEDIEAHKAEVEQELNEQRQLTIQKNSQLAAEAQHYATDLRRRADEQMAANQQQLSLVQQDIQARRQTLAQVQSELDTAQQKLVQSRQEGAAAHNELNQLKQHLDEINQELTTQLSRLEAAKHAAETAERHARDVRARVQREAERVAQLAAAAVMAAAARGADTGEYPQVEYPPAAPRSNGDQPAESYPAEETLAPPAPPPPPPAAQEAPTPTQHQEEPSENGANRLPL